MNDQKLWTFIRDTEKELMAAAAEAREAWIRGDLEAEDGWNKRANILERKVDSLYEMAAREA